MAPQPPRRLRPRQLRRKPPRRIPRRAAISRRTPGPQQQKLQAFAVSQYKASTARVPRTWLNNWPLSSTARRSNRKCRTGVDFEFRRGPGRCHGDHRGCREADRLHDQCDRQSLTRQDRGLPGPVRAAGATRASARPPVTSDSRSRWSGQPHLPGERWPASSRVCSMRTSSRLTSASPARWNNAASCPGSILDDDGHGHEVRCFTTVFAGRHADPRLRVPAGPERPMHLRPRGALRKAMTSSAKRLICASTCSALASRIAP